MALMLAATATAQDKKGDNPEDNEVDMDNLHRHGPRPPQRGGEV